MRWPPVVNLDAAEQQVERRVFFGRRIIHCVERALLGGIMRDEHEIGAVFFGKEPGDQLFLFRLQVIGIAILRLYFSATISLACVKGTAGMDVISGICTPSSAICGA